MSLVEAQGRMAELASRFAAMSPARSTTVTQPAASARPATAVTADAFTARLDQALAAASSGSAAASGSVAPGPAAGLGGRTSPGQAALVETAKSWLGVPYVWGGTSRKGVDCSGFVQAVFRAQGIDLPRVAKDQARVGRPVSPADAQPGDLVAFDNSKARAGIDHIGLYLGDGKWIAAPSTGDVVKVQSVDLSRAVTIRRILPDEGLAVVSSMRESEARPDWTARLPPAAAPVLPALLSAAKSTGVDPQLLVSLAWTESGFSSSAVSQAGAQGLMQLMPATARGLGVDPLDPAQAALGAARFLSDQLAAHGGRVDLALASYNAGPGAVRKYGGVPPYAETRGHLASVLGHVDTLRGRS